MAYSYVRYTGNGSTTNYTFPFPSISQDHIKVRLDGVLTTQFSFLNATTIQLFVAPANGVIIEIRRETPKESPIVNFTDGSVLLERDLDLLATYDLYLAQETADTVEGAITEDSLGRWNAQNKRIGNVADPVNPQDAATKNWAETSGASFVAQAASSAGAAAGSASAASTSASQAASSASSASTSASNAASSASAASTSATSSATSATASESSATAAAGSASTATTKASEASASASAAASSAAAALTSENNAASSAVSAANSAAAAATALDNFDDRYLGPKASDPTVDNDGNALLIGALYSNTATGKMRFYTATGWVDASAAMVAALITYEYVATAGQTSFSGNDANGLSLAYTVGGLIVSLNGSVLRPGDDFTASNGTSIVLVSPASAGDELQVHAFGSFEVADAYTRAQVDAGFASKSLVNAFASQQYAIEATLTDAASISWNLSSAQVARVTLAGNRTFAAPSNQQAGAFYGLMVVQDATGSRTAAWNSVFKFPNALAPTLTTTANARDFFVFRSDGTNMYLVGRSQDVR